MSRKQRTAFMSGVVTGFTSPFRVFVHEPMHLSCSHTDTVSSAWHRVGRYLDEATTIEGRKIGKKPAKEKERAVAN